jgi:hypothetical protein
MLSNYANADSQRAVICTACSVHIISLPDEQCLACSYGLLVRLSDVCIFGLVKTLRLRCKFCSYPSLLDEKGRKRGKKMKKKKEGISRDSLGKLEFKGEVSHQGTWELRFVHLSFRSPQFFFFYYSYVHTRLGSSLPPAPTPSLSHHPLNPQQKLFCPYF